MSGLKLFQIYSICRAVHWFQTSNGLCLGLLSQLLSCQNNSLLLWGRFWGHIRDCYISSSIILFVPSALSSLSRSSAVPYQIQLLNSTLQYNFYNSTTLWYYNSDRKGTIQIQFRLDYSHPSCTTSLKFWSENHISSVCLQKYHQKRR